LGAVLPKLVIDVPYDVLERISKAYPDLPPEVAVKQFIIDSLGGEASLPPPQQYLDISKIQRSIQDLINPFTAKVDDVARRLGSVVELLDELAERVKSLEEEVKSLKTKAEQQAVPQPVKEVRKSAMDVLKDQKVMFEKDIAQRIRNRDAFFEKLRREGAVVIEAKGQRVAVEPQFWEEFKETINELDTNNEYELKEKLSKVEYGLLKTLWESGLLYFDSINKKWKFTEHS